MSIIYDALKKVEESSDRAEKFKINKKTVKSKPKYKALLSYLLIACLGIFLANIFFIFLSRQLPANSIPALKKQPRINENLKPPVNTQLSQASIKKNKPQLIETASSVPIEAQKEPASFVLNGVFFSNHEGYALINNRIVKENDEIDGATVRRIALGEVELELKSGVIKLSGDSR